MKIVNRFLSFINFRSLQINKEKYLNHRFIFMHSFQKYFLNPFILLFILIIFSSEVNDDYTLLNSLPFSGVTFLTTDQLGNAFVVVENQLLEFNSKGKPVANFSRNDLGALLYVDASNPMKILLFYPDFAKAIILDSKLSPQSVISFRELKINQPLTVCSSKENGYWVYDREDDQLKKIDPSLQIIQQSGNLTQLIGYQLQPGRMVEENGLVYINNPTSGVLVFDRYGNYFKTIPYQNLSNFQVIEKDILFINKNKLFRFDSKSLSESEILLPKHDSILSIRLEQHELYLLTSDSLNFYYF
jgi:hypothetical protein